MNDRMHPRTIAALTAALVGAAVLVGVPTAASAAPLPYQDPTKNVPTRVADLLGRMTLDEKIGQMTLIERRWLSDDGLASGMIGAGFSAGTSAPASNTVAGWEDMYDGFQRAALRNRLGIPMLYAMDAVHGAGNVHGATIFPHNIGLGATHDPALVQQIGHAVAQEVSALGIDLNFAPTVAVVRNDRWGRTYESFGEDPALVSSMTTMVTGEQGPSLSAPDSILALTKHFVGDGGTTGGVDRGNTQLSETELRAIHLPPFREAVRRGVSAVMVSYSSWNGARLHGDRYLLTDVLKKELGFSGILVSDYGGVDYLDGDKTTLSAYDVRTAVNAGIDLVMVPDEYSHFHAELVAEVHAGRVSRARIDDAVSRILTKKFQKGLFEHPYADRSLAGQVGSAAHRALARKAVAESTVVVKNERGLLPLPRSASKVFVAGSGADDIGRQSGGWTMGWQGSLGPIEPGTTILGGIRAAVDPGTTVTYSPDGSGIDDSYHDAVVVVGERPYAEYEGDDTGDMRLSAADRAVLERVTASGVPTTLVLVSGRPLDIDEQLGSVRAAVEAWLPGTEGAGVADVLYGRVPATGTLPVTWMHDAGQQPINAGDGQNALFSAGYGLHPTAGQSAYDTIGAVYYDDQRGTATEDCRDTACGRALAHLADGDFAGWFGVDFGGTAPRTVSVRLASGATATGTIEVRTGSPAGPVLARIPVASTGGWQNWVTRTARLALSPTGTDRVYLRFVGGGTGTADEFVNVNWLVFSH